MEKKAKLRGVGQGYVRLLREAGVDRVSKLLAYEKSSDQLLHRLARANARTGVVRRLPSETRVDAWIRDATFQVRAGIVSETSRLSGRVGYLGLRSRTLAVRDIVIRGPIALAGRPKMSPIIRDYRRKGAGVRRARADAEKEKGQETTSSEAHANANAEEEG